VRGGMGRSGGAAAPRTPAVPVCGPRRDRQAGNIMSIARQPGGAPDAVLREYERRRSNRQVFVGVLPAFVMAVAAAAVNPWWGWSISGGKAAWD
jgi:hypothetical protein